MGNGFLKALSTFLFPAVLGFCKEECYSPFPVNVWGVNMSVQICVWLDLPLFRSTLLKLFLLVTTTYYIRITIMDYEDTQ